MTRRLSALFIMMMASSYHLAGNLNNWGLWIDDLITKSQVNKRKNYGRTWKNFSRRSFRATSHSHGCIAIIYRGNICVFLLIRWTSGCTKPSDDFVVVAVVQYGSICHMVETHSLITRVIHELYTRDTGNYPIIILVCKECLMIVYCCKM